MKQHKGNRKITGIDVTVDKGRKLISHNLYHIDDLQLLCFYFPHLYFLDFTFGLKSGSLFLSFLMLYSANLRKIDTNLLNFTYSSTKEIVKNRHSETTRKIKYLFTQPHQSS